jgi:hypothetical protein
MMGLFSGTLAKFQLGAIETGGAGAAISVSLTDFAATGAVPEPFISA